MDLAEHHMFCGGSDGSIFQVDLCTWVSGGGSCGGARGWGLRGWGPLGVPSSLRPGPCAPSQTVAPAQPPVTRESLCSLALSTSAARAEREELPAGAGQREGVQRAQVRGQGVGDTLFSCSWVGGHLHCPLWGLSVPRNQVTCLSVSTDGSVLLSGSHDETVRLWDVQSKQCIRTVTLKGGARPSQGWGPRSSSERPETVWLFRKHPSSLARCLGGRAQGPAQWRGQQSGPFLDAAGERRGREPRPRPGRA